MNPCYCIANRAFPTKERLKEHIRAVRDRTGLGETITDPVVLTLLRLHPEWEQKSQGMTAVGTAMVKGHPSALPQKQIVLLRGDDEPMDISWSKLVARLQPDGKLRHPTDGQEALAELRVACRQLIEPQLAQLAPLRRPGLHVDHVYPLTFEQLLYNWVKRIVGLRVRDLKVTSTDGLTVVRRFVNQKHEDSWLLYHEWRADLEAITPEEHARRPVSRMNWEPLL